jgi:hypothetical protein
MLSDYERRVVDEFEREFDFPGHRSAVLWRHRFPVAVAAVLLAVAVLSALALVPALAAAIVLTLLGVGTGYLLAGAVRGRMTGPHTRHGLQGLRRCHPWHRSRKE